MTHNPILPSTNAEALTMPPNAPMLAALNAKSRRSGVPLYEGTVPAADVARRRAKNKAARQSRRANRGRR